MKLFTNTIQISIERDNDKQLVPVETISSSSDLLKLQLLYDDPKSLSNYQEQDTLKVFLTKSTFLFFSNLNLSLIIPQSKSIVIPQFISEGNQIIHTSIIQI
ncbi:hypothetical protein FGO68_gene11482 [Halteria grandinella]|uniref:Uncharacterized protein n=1 Tax=Halteria grandinella TaxID=5974 RepID=A0A8J8P9H7_HALGN|nr:hypothetical protein FGO68_gene11482 [Halteria grandinella]